MTEPNAQADLIIVGAGAAGLAAAIFAGEAARDANLPTPPRIVVLEGARKPGAKILISGGGRCNVTHDRVTEADFCGGPAPFIRKVLLGFDADATRAWMETLGVELKLEPTGKYFPVTDQARTVLDALFRRLRELKIEHHLGARVRHIKPAPRGFEIDLTPSDAPDAPGAPDQSTPLNWQARRVIIATGGLALPKSGSDGAGLQWMRDMGHTIIPTTPALVALRLNPIPGPAGRFAELSGVSFDAYLSLAIDGKLTAQRSGSLLFTHEGISGPVAMDISRHWLRAQRESPHSKIELRLGHPRWPGPEAPHAAEAWIQAEARRQPKRTLAHLLSELFPERWALALLGTQSRHSSVGSTSISQLSRDLRRTLARDITQLPLDIAGDRGYTFAETTAGGVSLRQVESRTLESRVVPGLHLCGEILDVDGYIGGYNFQWAWASGRAAGRGAIAALPAASA